VKNLRGCEDRGSREVSGIEVELWVAASGEDWNSGPKLDVGAANGLQEVVELAAAAGKSLPGFCFVLRLFGGL
jgi:hypothetical protein